MAFDEFDFFEPILVECDCGELAQLSWITFRLVDGSPPEQTDYYLICDNCGARVEIGRFNGHGSEATAIMAWKAWRVLKSHNNHK